MAWPDKLSQVRCYGFDKKYLPTLKRAIDEEMIEWGKCDLFIDLGTARFTFAGCEWEFEEMRETVTSFRLIKGTITPEDLTAAVLRG
jgi:hypothetical protein